MCSDTEEVAINSACRKFWKKVQSPCSITKGCLWLEAHLKWIGDSCQAVWESNYEVIKTEWDLPLKEDCHSFEINKIMDGTEQLLWIKEAVHSKIYPCESEAGVQGRKKTLAQSLKQYHSHFYWLYEKVWPMPWLACRDSDDAFRCTNISTRMGLKSFFPWCVKLGWNIETIAINLWEVHYRMAIMCELCWGLLACLHRASLTITQGAR